MSIYGLIFEFEKNDWKFVKILRNPQYFDGFPSIVFYFFGNFRNAFLNTNINLSAELRRNWWVSLGMRRLIGDGTGTCREDHIRNMGLPPILAGNAKNLYCYQDNVLGDDLDLARYRRSKDLHPACSLFPHPNCNKIVLA